MKKFKVEYISSFLAGMFIAIGCVANLSVNNKYIGAFLFSIGLYTVIRFRLSLYTGRIGYVCKCSDIVDMIQSISGNILGGLFVTSLIAFSRLYPSISEKANTIITTKINDNVVSWIVLSYMCGILMYIAVENSRRCLSTKKDISCIFGIVIPIMIFVLCGFNHCITDFCYMVLSPDHGWRAAAFFGVSIVGNGLGALTVSRLNKVMESKTNH